MRFFLVVLLTLSSCAVAASPSPGVQNLMNQPASLFDLGMQRLPPNINMFDGFYRAGSHNRKASLDLNWRYEREDNRIVGSLSVRDLDSDMTAMNAGCKEVLGQLGIWVGKSLPKIFMHQGWDWDDHTDETRALDAELREMFVFSCTVYGQSSTDKRFGGSMTLGEEMTVD